MEKWFGKSWGAPCCDPEDHTETPVGRRCLLCDEHIRAGDQGLLTGCFRAATGFSIEPIHLDCYLKKIRPHGPECVHCRGRSNRSEHKMDCAFARSGADCDCYSTWA